MNPRRRWRRTRLGPSRPTSKSWPTARPPPRTPSRSAECVCPTRSRLVPSRSGTAMASPSPRSSSPTTSARTSATRTRGRWSFPSTADPGQPRSGCTSPTPARGYLKIDDEGFPVQPYGIQENPDSILDVADIVYIDPVNTGFSRILNDAEPLAVLRRQRGRLLPGALAGHLRHASGSLDQSQVPDRGVVRHDARLRSGRRASGQPVDVPERRDPRLAHRASASNARARSAARSTCRTTQRPPGFTRCCPPTSRARDLDDLLPEVEAFTLDELYCRHWRAAALCRRLRPEQALVERYARYSGLEPSAVRQYNMAVPTSFFWKELLARGGALHRAARLALPRN